MMIYIAVTESVTESTVTESMMFFQNNNCLFIC